MITPYAINTDGKPSMNNNVLEIYKNNTVEEIRADLEPKRTELVNIFANLTSDFNKASGIRANNAFLGKAVYIVGRHKYNRVGAVGTYLYEHVFHATDMKELFDKLHNEHYTIYAVDNIAKYNPKNIWDVEFPAKSAFVYGEECKGLDKDVINLCDGMVYINQIGSVRSLNVAQAAACVMSEYSRQHRRE